MRIVGFLQNFNNVDNGLLEKCLTSMCLIADDITVYDDASTEKVMPIYKEFGCIVVYGQKNEFEKELFHKQSLLITALFLQPDWLVWFDSDAILGRHWENRERTEKSLTYFEQNNIDLIMLHNLNLWRSPWWYRTDQKFNDLNHGVFWRNTGELHYKPIAQLHQRQFPLFYYDDKRQARSTVLLESDKQLLHLGFSTENEIAKKYFTYRAKGQTGWALERLVDESTLELTDVPEEWFPLWFLEGEYQPRSEKPMPIFSPSIIEKYETYQEWQKAFRFS